MLNRILFILISLFSAFFNSIQSQTNSIPRPKLVVGMVVDQMRWDYLYRYYDRYSNDGFKRLLREGYSCENTMIPYTPTYTAPGHTCIYTGSVPAIHGIIGNNWYSREIGKMVYCTDDSVVTTVGSSSTAGHMSPRNMWTTTITDELRLASNFHNKVIGIALKDRASILPAGHSANAAYWFDNASGGWITSSYYMNDLPAWVKKMNDKKLPDQYLKKEWNTLYPIATYINSSKDKNVFESEIPGEAGDSFPHITSTIKTDKYNSFRFTPSANTYTFDMSKAAIEAEALGKNSETDFLAISLSSTDYIGHVFGPNSIEVEDTYLRLDKDLGDFLVYLDKQIGKGQYLVFLSADHGVAHVPAFAREYKMLAGAMDDNSIRLLLNKAVDSAYGVKNAILYVVNYQVYTDAKAIRDAKGDADKIKNFIIQQLLSYPAIANAFYVNKLTEVALPQFIKNMLINGHNQELSGDVQFIFKPQWFDGGDAGTTHGAWNPYDSHIPLLWFGWHVTPGKTNRETYMTDIAPTLAAMLHIQMPNGSIGHVIEEVVK